MKKFLILLVLSFISISTGWAQKFGYTDMEFITSKMPEYQQAQAEMKKFSEKWAKEIDDKFAEVARMQRAYMAEEVLLTDDLKRKRQTEIKEKELEAREYNSKIFGMEGLLFQKKKELMKPVLEKVQRAVRKVCAQRRLDFLFDKSSDASLVFTNPMLDYSDYIMDELGLNEKQTKDAPGNEATSKKAKAPEAVPETQVKDNPKTKKSTTIKPK
jgi:outer membrane protein